jgi:uncharacterized protein (TIGR00369 family)
VELADLIDIELLERTDNEVRALVPVTDRLKQPLGLVHGGVYATIADILTTATGRAVSNQTSFLRPITQGHVHATARRRHNGRTTAVWEVDISDDEGRLCALVRITLTSRQVRGATRPGAGVPAAGTRS